jgi:hypothetical protein
VEVSKQGLNVLPISSQARRRLARPVEIVLFTSGLLLAAWNAVNFFDVYFYRLTFVDHIRMILLLDWGRITARGLAISLLCLGLGLYLRGLRAGLAPMRSGENLFVSVPMRVVLIALGIAVWSIYVADFLDPSWGFWPSLEMVSSWDIYSDGLAIGALCIGIGMLPRLRRETSSRAFSSDAA